MFVVNGGNDFYWFTFHTFVALPPLPGVGRIPPEGRVGPTGQINTIPRWAVLVMLVVLVVMVGRFRCICQLCVDGFQSLSFLRHV